jgi:hypothetical protein
MYFGIRLTNRLGNAGRLVSLSVFGPGGEMLARVDAGGPHYYQTDRQGSVLWITTPAGGLVKRVFYAETGREGDPTYGQAGYQDRFEMGGRPSDGSRASTSDRYDHGSSWCHRHVTVNEVRTAAARCTRIVPERRSSRVSGGIKR